MMSASREGAGGGQAGRAAGSSQPSSASEAQPRAEGSRQAGALRCGSSEPFVIPRQPLRTEHHLPARALGSGLTAAW